MWDIDYFPFPNPTKATLTRVTIVDIKFKSKGEKFPSLKMEISKVCYLISDQFRAYILHLPLKKQMIK